ncbi:MAG: helix-turn-helix transcriptional regulator [Clostridia bacterium]|nr:helix-turn-helix transcriptional regulator [Clostridia bacterium]
MHNEDTKFPFSMYKEAGEGRIVNSRSHANSMEIVEVTSGTVMVQIGTELVAAGEGDFLYIPPSMTFRVDAATDFASVRGMIFDISIIEENLENFDSEVFYMFYVQSKNRVTVFGTDHPVNPTLKRFMKESYDEYTEKEICYKLPIRANIYHMMTSLLRYYCGSKNELDRMIYHNVLRLRPVITYIDEHFREKIYIEELSAMINVSPDYFTKMFKESIGKTPIDYINGMRVNSAMELLCTSEMSMTEIADAIGFCNPNYFHKIFKQYMLTSPLAYRKSAK